MQTPMNAPVEPPAACLPLPNSPGYCVLFPEVLTLAECQTLIAQSDRAGFRAAHTDYPPSYRNNQRLVWDDEALADRLLPRLVARAPVQLPPEILAAHGLPATDPWTLSRINPRFRFCRYEPGQTFFIHQDGVYQPEPDERSFLTILLYLTDGDMLEGGDTLFFASGPGSETGFSAAPLVLARVRPRAGSLLLFDHRLWHAGETVRSGVKHVLRSDLLYRRIPSMQEPAPPDGTTPAPPIEVFASVALPSPVPASALLPGSSPFPLVPPPKPRLGHQGYVWTLAKLPAGRWASGGRDRLIRLWNQQDEPDGCLIGHAQSVLGLVPLDGGRLASVSRDRTLRLWDLKWRRCEEVWTFSDAALLSAVRLEVAGPEANGHERLAVGSADGRIRVLDPAQPAGSKASLDALRVLEGHAGWVWALAWDGRWLFSASEDGSVRCWDPGSGQCLAVLEGAQPLRTLALLPDGGLVTGSLDGLLSRWELVTESCHDGHVVVNLPAWRLKARWQAHQAAIFCVTILDETTLASGGEDNRVCIWHLPSLSLLQTHRHENFVTDILPLDETSYLTSAYDGQIVRRRWPVRNDRGLPPGLPV